MSVKKFKFVSPGVFINEIDNSFIPRQPENIGPVVIGRSRRGLAMQPVKVESYSDFVEMFGETVPGMGGGDIYRDGNYQSPMYGTYAAKAFLNAGVAPLTYIRLLGQQDPSNNTSTDAQAGWKVLNTITNVPSTNGGAYGLWLFSTQSAGSTNTEILGTGSLAATFYINEGRISLSGTMYGGIGNTHAGNSTVTASTGVPIGDSSNLHTLVISSSNGGSSKVEFGFDDSSSNWVRKKFNTNPQLISGTTFYTPGAAGSGSATGYWLGETYGQRIRDQGLTTSSIGVVFAIAGPSSATPANMKNQASTEGRTGWFIGQALSAPSAYVPFNSTRLFRLIGRGHGEWLQKSVKVSISNVRASTSTSTEYGTFSVVLRSISDTDSAVQVMERFDNVTLDPTSPDYVARVIGDKYTQWDTTERRLKTYGEFDNNSKFVYVDMNPDVEAGGTDPTLLPFGYFGPPKFRTIYDLNMTGNCNFTPGAGNSGSNAVLTDSFLTGGVSIVSMPPAFANAAVSGVKAGATSYLSGGLIATGSLEFPHVRLRTSASDGGLSDATDAYFGMQTTRTATSTDYDPSVPSCHRLLYSGYNAGGGSNATDPNTVTGVDDWAYVFSLDDIVLSGSSANGWFYSSGSRAREDSYTSGAYSDLLNAGINKFTCPIFGGFDGFDIMKPDPLYNTDMGSTNESSYRYYTYKRAIDTVADPEFVNMNLLAVPGLTNNGLTQHMINVCEDRADSLALIDLANVYIPAHEVYKASKVDRIGTTPTTAANALRDRRIDSSYGCTFYPWVQTRDDNTGRMLWIPPTVAMMGVLASSEARSAVWFAPAGFNRGGLTDGAAGIPITGITQRLTSKERDTLYENNINPIASFPSNGIVVFGQKTLQERQSALDRINVRRLVIFLKKQISVLSTRILFEQNVQATWNRFVGLVQPLLANVKTRFGITDYRLILDETTTTPDLIDQNIMYAKIMVKPARAIEYIAIDFVIMSTGASFED